MDGIVAPRFARTINTLSLFPLLCFFAIGDSAIAAPTGTVPTIANPVVVRVGVIIRNLVGIDEVRENWQLTGLLIAKWSDPKLRYRARGRGRRFRDLPTTMWKPSFEFANEDRPTDFRFVDFYVEPDGTVVFTQAFNALLSTDLDLRRFPFDSERLPLAIQARGDDLDRVILTADREGSALPKQGYAALAQWHPVALTERLGSVPGSASNANEVEYALTVERNPQSYIYKFIVPLLLLVIISWVTFWLSHEEFKTKDQLGSAVSTLLIIVAFNITATTVLPRTEYITYIDAILFTCFVFVVISIATIVGTHLLQVRHSEKRALAVRRFAGYALPIAFLLTQAILFVEFHIAG